VAGVALMTLGWIWWRAWSPLVARGAAALFVAGVALARRLISISFCMAGVARGDINVAFAWQVWRL